MDTDNDKHTISATKVANLKKALITDVGRSVQWHRIKTVPLEIREDIDKLANHRAIWNPVGASWAMVFTRRNNIGYSFFLQRSKIFHRNPRFIAFSLEAEMSMYDGTIIEGQMVSDKSDKDGDSKQVFIMQDVHMLCGEDMSRINWLDKMIRLKDCVERKLKMVPLSKSFEISIETGTPMSELRKMVEKGTEHIPWKTKGLVFMPPKSGTRWSFIDAEPVMKKPEEKFSVPKDSRMAILEVCKGTIQDVYQLYASDKKGVRTNIGLAGIPSITISAMCVAMFKQSGKRDSDTLLARCYLDKNTAKWVPFELANGRRAPDKI
jgi:hypothetical protein